MPLFGSHLSIAGSMTNALDEAERLGFDTVQVFTKNQRQWKVTPLKDDDVRAWRDRVRALGWQDRVVAHNSYLVNLASPDDTLRDKSIALQREEIERAERLGIPYLVSHPGAHTGSGEEAGLERIAEAYAVLLKEADAKRVVVCLENTVGSGSNLGGPFEHLRELRDRILKLAGKSYAPRVGFCFDTCHAHAAGHDLRTQKSAEDVLRAFERAVGVEHIRVVHLNDSKAALASRLDRHAHVGEGTIAGPLTEKGRRDYGGFAAVLNHPALAAVPMILETPKEDDDQGRPWDIENLDRLRRLLTPSKGRNEPVTPRKRSRVRTTA